MVIIRTALGLFVAVILLLTASSAGSAQVPLFDSSDVLELTLEADIKALRDDRDEENEERPARILWSVAGEESGSADLKVRTRGNFRLKKKNCRMPPLRLNFRTSAMEGTPFQGQDKIKLVGYCRDKDDYEQNVLEEYTIYRLYNLLTDMSFRVRLARLTYVDTSGDDDPITRYGFLIEDEDQLAERLGGRMLEVPAVHPSQFPAPETPVLSIFQFMVGNTDWSMVRFHNVKLFQKADGTGVPIPYDFDWTGLVSAPYARPDVSLGTRSVRQRLYRGFCRDEVAFPELYARFSALRDEFHAVLTETQGLEEDSLKKAREYLDDFFEIIEDEGKARRQIERSCRSMS